MGRSLAMLSLVACGPTVALPGDEATGEATAGSTASQASTSAGPTPVTSTTGTSTTGRPDDTGVATFGDRGSTTSGEWGFTTELISESSGGGQCMSNEECESGMCYLQGILGGICSECLGDADCEWGCSPPNPLTSPPTGAMCNDGTIGDGCETDAACMDGLRCGLVLDVPGILSISTCGECLQDPDCTDDRVCAPNVKLAELGGQLECVEPGSKPDGETCNVDALGQECASTHCASADIMGLVQIGVCSECSNVEVANEGCDPGQTCEDPSVDLDGAVAPGACV